MISLLEEPAPPPLFWIAGGLAVLGIALMLFDAWRRER